MNFSITIRTILEQDTSSYVSRVAVPIVAAHAGQTAHREDRTVDERGRERRS